MSAIKTEAMLSAAFDRLVAGKPENADLVTLAQRLGLVRVNLASVCKEAGLSRSLLCDTNSRYADLRRKILDYAVKPQVCVDKLQRRQLELENLVSELRDRIDMRDLQNAELLVRLRRMQLQSATTSTPVEKRNAALKVVMVS
jgi:hypothetical protein